MNYIDLQQLLKFTTDLRESFFYGSVVVSFKAGKIVNLEKNGAGKPEVKIVSPNKSNAPGFEIRCPFCQKLQFKGVVYQAQIKCIKCKRLIEIKAKNSTK